MSDNAAWRKQVAAMYWRVRREPKEGTMDSALKSHSQACGFVAYAFDVHPDEVAQIVIRGEQR